MSLGTVPLGLTVSLSLTIILPVYLCCVSDNRRGEGRKMRSLKYWTERRLVATSNVSTLFFISFVIYRSFNFSRSHLSHVILGYSEAGTKSRFLVTWTPVTAGKGPPVKNTLLICSLVPLWNGCGLHRT